jgi:transposase
MKQGRAGTMTHDYKRHGVTTLLAALNVMKRHRHQEFIRFLNVIDTKVPKKKTVHVIVDNYAAHKHPKVLEWIEQHPLFVFHFTPTSAFWLNAVGGFFAKLTKKRLKRGVFRSLQELKDAIHRFLDDTNANPKPFTWTKDPNKIIAAVKRGHQALFDPLVAGPFGVSTIGNVLKRGRAKSKKFRVASSAPQSNRYLFDRMK